MITSDYLWKKFDRAIGISFAMSSAWRRDYLEGKISFKKFNNRFDEYYRRKKITLDLLNQIMKDISINPDAIKIIQYLKRVNVGVAIVSSGLSNYVGRYAKLLQIAVWKANSEIIFDKRGKFVGLSYLTDEATAKVLHVKEICIEKNIRPTETIFVGDDTNDSKVFELTKHGVLYKNPKSMTSGKSWAFIENLIELKRLVGKFKE